MIGSQFGVVAAELAGFHAMSRTRVRRARSAIPCRAQGFDKTSMAEITALVGGSKATIYSHFPSKEELFVECMMATLENYMSGTLKHLEASRGDPGAALRNFGTSVLNFICSPEQVPVYGWTAKENKRSLINDSRH